MDLNLSLLEFMHFWNREHGPDAQITEELARQMLKFTKDMVDKYKEEDCWTNEWVECPDCGNEFEHNM